MALFGKKAYYTKHLRKLAKDLDRPSPILDYPTNKEGLLATKRVAYVLNPSAKALSPTHPGSVDWVAAELFEGTEEFVRWAETTIDASGLDRDRALFEFCLLYREWERKWKLQIYDKPPTLNQVCYALKLRGADIVEKVVTGMRTLMKELGRSKASFAVPKVMAAAITRAQGEFGTKDTEMILRIAGVSEPSGTAVQVNVNQQQGIQVNMTAGERERLKTPLLQFTETVEAVDEKIREKRTDYIEGELVDGRAEDAVDPGEGDPA